MQRRFVVDVIAPRRQAGRRPSHASRNVPAACVHRLSVSLSLMSLPHKSIRATHVVVLTAAGHEMYIPSNCQVLRAVTLGGAMHAMEEDTARVW